MGDCYTGNIYIGGNVTKSQFEKFLSVINDVYDLNDFSEDLPIDKKVEAVKPSEVWRDYSLKISEIHIHFYDSETIDGQFPEIEELLREEGIPYIRKSSEFCEFSAEMEVFIPELDEDRTIILTSNYEEFVVKKPLYDILEKLKAGNTEEGITELEKTLGKKIPALPKLIMDKDLARLLYNLAGKVSMIKNSGTVKERI